MIAVYARVSSATQNTASQDADLKRWAAAQSEQVRFYSDKASGLKMDRPAFNRLMAGIRCRKVTKLVVWRLDRLGRTAKGLLELFDELKALKCGFVSLRDAIDLGTASGRLLLTVLAGVAQFETEVRGERQQAGIEAARAKHGGKCPWGGRRVGTRITVTEEKEAAVREMKAAGKPIAEIARVTGLSRMTCYRVLGTQRT